MKENPIELRLTTAPGVRPVTASALVATIDDITRFRTAHELEAYLGMIPSAHSSGDSVHPESHASPRVRAYRTRVNRRFRTRPS